MYLLPTAQKLLNFFPKNADHNGKVFFVSDALFKNMTMYSQKKKMFLISLNSLNHAELWLVQFSTK